MSRRLDYSKRARIRPFLTHDEKADFTRSAKAMSERVAKGWRSPQARLHGEVRRLTAEEIEAVTAKLKQEGRL